MPSKTSFLLWNIRGNATGYNTRRANIRAALRNLIQSRHPQILLLVECVDARQEMLDAINIEDQPPFSCYSDKNDKVQLFSTLEHDGWDPVYRDDTTGRFSMYRLQLPRETILVATMHFFDKRTYPNLSDRTLYMRAIVDKIIQAERDQGIDKTVLVGDLNMNPYEEQIVSPKILNARMTRKMAAASMSVAFYNPMWGFFGDRELSPPGTYYFPKTQGDNHFWHIFDQVLLRPGLSESLIDLEIITHDGNQSMVTPRMGKPRENQFSDHLPIYFALKE